MGSDKTAKVVAMLARLTPGELEHVEQAARFLRNGEGTASDNAVPVAVSVKDDLVLETLARTMSSMGVEHTTVDMLRKSPQYSSFKPKAAAVVNFLMKAGVRRRIEQIVVLQIGIRLLYDNLAEMGGTVSSRLVMTHLHRIPSVINRAFPGYASAGMLNWIVKRKHRGQANAR